MLVRKQILIPAWLEAYVKTRSSIAKQSECEIVRGLMCLGLQYIFQSVGRPIDSDLAAKAAKFAKEVAAGTRPDNDEVRLWMDDLFFDTRKVTEEYVKKNGPKKA